MQSPSELLTFLNIGYWRSAKPNGTRTALLKQVGRENSRIISQFQISIVFGTSSRWELCRMFVRTRRNWEQFQLTMKLWDELVKIIDVKPIKGFGYNVQYSSILSASVNGIEVEENKSRNR